MKNKKIYIMLVVSILLTVIGVSLAYFSLNIIGNDTAKYNTITTGDLALTYTDTSELSFDNALPGDSITKTIIVKNTGTEEVSYNLTWQELINTIINNELVIEGTCKNLNSSNTEDGKCSAISKKVVKEGNVTSNIPIKPGYTHEYTITITFIDTGRSQNYNKNKTFKGKLGLTESSAKTVYCTYDGELTQGAEYVNGQYTYRYMQKKVRRTQPIDAVWKNMDEEGWGVALTDKESTEPVTTKLCTYINDKPLISTSSMFQGSAASSIDLSSFNTSNITDMHAMFEFSSQKELNLSSFNTSNVITMLGLFRFSEVNLLNLNSFNTSSVTVMDGMFANSKITTLDLSNFDTSNVTSTQTMFDSSNAVELDLSSFDTSKVTNMQFMFGNSSNLRKIYVSDKFILNDTDGRLGANMFKACKSIIGGNGTSYDSTHTNGEYARIDGGTSSPGYFTDIADKPVKPYSFSTDSWVTIANAVKNNNISKYNVGDTKKVNLGTYGTHTVRIANTSTPSECSTDGFSQSACGFVIEFADIITTHNMNDTDTNVGGWPASSMYTFVNTNIYNALPYILKSEIIDTTVVSGHGSNDTDNFTSTDKLYLLSPKEVYNDWSTDSYSSYDSAKDLTRALDYYINKNVTLSDDSEAIKKYKTTDSWWWLREAHSSYDNVFFIVQNNDYRYLSTNANISGGVSPAFRLG